MKRRNARLVILLLMICALMTAFAGTTAFAADAAAYGDADGDGSVTALDASLVLRHSAGTATVKNTAAADVDGNGTINALDASLILCRSVGLIAAFPAESTGSAVETASKSLVVYFSWSGNTKDMAETIAELTDSDLYELIPLNAYPEDYTACTEVALAERDSNARPAINDPLTSISEYDTIYIGYPIWWHTAPMIVGTFLESYDLEGIDVYPFTQSASMDEEQFENSMAFVRECAGKGTVHAGLFTRASDISGITRYLTDNGLIK